MKNKNKNLTSFADHLDQQYGKRGTKVREKYEEEFEGFKLGAMLQEVGKEFCTDEALPHPYLFWQAAPANDCQRCR